MRYGRGEEVAHAVSHGLGVVFALGGLVELLRQSLTTGDGWRVATGAVFGVSLVILYTASTIYHSFPAEHPAPLLRALDRSAIYLLIAGSYTPVTLVGLGGAWGWSLFALVWTGAVFGIALEVRRHRLQLPSSRGQQVLTVGLYLVMGWCVLLAFQPLTARVAPAGITLFVLGGLAYTAGVGFYAAKRLRFHHLIWHLFVLAGSALHYAAILLYVIRVRG
jgi:hemolysin III